MENELFIKRITLKANLEKLAGKINAAQWDEGNALPDGEYSADSLEWYLRGEGNFFFVCFIGSDLAGMASAQLLPRAYGKHSTLYVDELQLYYLNFVSSSQQMKCRLYFYCRY